MFISYRQRSVSPVRYHKEICYVPKYCGRCIEFVHLLQWNSRGYDVAKLFAHKFTYISPVWLQIQRKSEAVYSVLGAHDIDKGQSSTLSLLVLTLHKQHKFLYFFLKTLSDNHKFELLRKSANVSKTESSVSLINCQCVF